MFTELVKNVSVCEYVYICVKMDSWPLNNLFQLLKTSTSACGTAIVLLALSIYIIY